MFLLINHTELSKLFNQKQNYEFTLSVLLICNTSYEHQQSKLSYDLHICQEFDTVHHKSKQIVL